MFREQKTRPPFLIRYHPIMKPLLLLIATTALAAPLAAQSEGPGNDLIELFEQSQREGASDQELMKLLENKALLDLEGAEFREVTPEEMQREKDAIHEMLQRLKSKAEPGDAGRPKNEARKAPEPELIPPPRWLVGLVVKPLDPALRSHFDLPDGAGVLVESVMRGGPAAKAGIKQNDIVVTANGQKISSLEELKIAVEKAGSAGKAMNLEVIQRGQKRLVKVVPFGPESMGGKPVEPGPGPANRPMIRIQRQMEAQQKEIELLQREVRELRARLEHE